MRLTSIIGLRWRWHNLRNKWGGMVIDFWGVIEGGKGEIRQALLVIPSHIFLVNYLLGTLRVTL